MTTLSQREREAAAKAKTEEAEKLQEPQEPQEPRKVTESEVATSEEVTESAEATDSAQDAESKESGDSGESTETAQAEPRRPGRIARTRIPAGTRILGVLVLVAVVLTVAVVVLWIKSEDLKATDDASRQAVRAASGAARDLSSYDYRTLESDFKTAAGETTGKLHDQYSALAQQIRATAVQQQAISQTTVLKAGTESVSADRVTVIVFANRSSTTTSSQNRLPDSLRIRMTMLKVKDRWLASDLQVL
ncbi:MAG TPA: hypothetical protein VGP70_29125 [Actinomadura sp.]|jgi:Mce-associated membrane protein|nr:hypothetical protein [Actinomadura sp.]